MNYWLLKTEPEDFSFHDLVQAGEEIWDGVRNAKAQKNMRSMQPGDLAFIYHTGREKAVTGVAEIASAAFPDPSDAKFAAVKLSARHPLPRPVTLAEIKALPQFADWELVRLPRLSVMNVPPAHWQAVLTMAVTGPDRRVP
ncbi:MAG: EVE domain-containing protein [Dethiobacter sp.]|jgi:predicted RNA-binding protein with PUA-like domain|nr:EVE domain-containing protein [Dethiobacter sp.]